MDSSSDSCGRARGHRGKTGVDQAAAALYQQRLAAARAELADDVQVGIGSRAGSAGGRRDQEATIGEGVRMFDADQLAYWMRQRGVTVTWLGQRLGARPGDPGFTAPPRSGRGVGHPASRADRHPTCRRRAVQPQPAGVGRAVDPGRSASCEDALAGWGCAPATGGAVAGNGAGELHRAGASRHPSQLVGGSLAYATKMLPQATRRAWP